jgi:hypothetical protein
MKGTVLPLMLLGFMHAIRLRDKFTTDSCNWDKKDRVIYFPSGVQQTMNQIRSDGAKPLIDYFSFDCILLQNRPRKKIDHRWVIRDWTLRPPSQNSGQGIWSSVSSSGDIFSMRWIRCNEIIFRAWHLSDETLIARQPSFRKGSRGESCILTFFDKLVVKEINNKVAKAVAVSKTCLHAVLAKANLTV